MTGSPILSRFQAFGSQFQAVFRLQDIGWPDLHTLWLHPERLPRYAAETPVVGRTLALLGPLDWGHFPERNLARHWCQPAVSYAAFAGAVLVKLNEGLESMGVPAPIPGGAPGSHTLARLPCGSLPGASLRL